jgi:hypothetical protein
MTKTSEELLQDISKLEGLKLASIRKGAEITIRKIDWNNKKIILETGAGTQRSRPFSEMERLWNSLCSKPAIHVDSELGGSGTSRNQPETILANLPYVEWFKTSNKKHLTLAEAPSHHFGTLKQMDAVKAEELKSLIKQAAANAASSAEPARMIAVSRDIAAHAEILEQSTGIKPKALEMGTYEFSLPSCRLVLVSETAVEGGLPPGTYLVLKGNPAGQPKGEVRIAGRKHTVAESEGLCLLFEN